MNNRRTDSIAPPVYGAYVFNDPIVSSTNPSISIIARRRRAGNLNVSKVESSVSTFRLQLS